MHIPNLRELRELHGLTQKELADVSGVSLRSVAGYEGGAHVRPNTARKLAQALNVEVADLVETSSYPKAQAPPSPTQPPLNGFEEERREIPDIEVVDTFFVPPEEGEEEDKVILKFYYVRLLEGDEPILKVMREASPDEEAMIRRHREKSGRRRE